MLQGNATVDRDAQVGLDVEVARVHPRLGLQSAEFALSNVTVEKVGRGKANGQSVQTGRRVTPTVALARTRAQTEATTVGRRGEQARVECVTGDLDSAQIVLTAR